MLENTSVLDKKALVALNISNFKRTLLPLTIVIELSIVLLLILTSPEEEPALVTGLWVFLVLFPLMNVLTGYAAIRKIYRSDKNVQNKAVVHFIFNDDSIDVDVKTDTNESKGRLAYSVIHKALDSKNYLFLFQNAVNSFILDKSAFTGGSAEDLIVLLKKNGVKVK